MKEFKIGDKVKIPKTKRGRADVFAVSVCARRAIEIKQDFLYFKGFEKSGGIVVSNLVILCDVSDDYLSAGDFFMLSEIELYEKVEETEAFMPLGIKNNGKDIFLVSEKDGTTSLQYKSN